MSVRQQARPSVFAIGNAHIDPVWIWDWKEGMREVVATFTAAADRLDSSDDLLFTASSASYYAWVEEVDPPLFSRIKEHVRSGRWLVAGGEWVEPDCNIPSGESVCRQLLYSQRYLQESLGTVAHVGYNIDSFGHAGSLPQLLWKGGLHSYVMMRPQEHEKALPSLFGWRGTDGTEVTTYRIPFAYNVDVQPAEPDVVRHRVEALMERAEREKHPLMLFFGVGDHGGGPTRHAVEELRRLRADTSGGVVFATPAGYFEAALDGGSPELPVVEGDLHMHAVGCYSAVAWMKALNARAERSLVDAERLAALAAIATGRPMEVNGKLAEAWKAVLFNQFHDSLGGTCTEEAFEDLREFYGYALSIADGITAKATQALSARVDTWVPGAATSDRYRSARPYVEHYPVPVVVFNPLSWALSAPVVLPHEGGSLTDDKGRPVTVQRVASGEGTRYSSHVLARVELPPSGYRLFWLREADVPEGGGPETSSVDLGMVASSTRLSNGLLDVVIDSGLGGVSGLRDDRGREWLTSEALRPVVLEDPSDTWSHGVTRYEADEHECEFVGAEPVEAGPVRATVRLTYKWHSSVIHEDLYLYAGQRALGMRLVVNWGGHCQLVKLIVPVAGAGPVATVGLPYGAIARAADGREEVMQHWVDVATADGGLGCASDVTYGYDLADGRLRLTLLRSPRYADHRAPWALDRGLETAYTDQGAHRISLLFVPHTGDWAEAGLPRHAEQHCGNFPVVTETWHRGTLPTSERFIEVEPDSVAVAVVKRAEDGSGWVVRVVETAGSRSVARVNLSRLARSWQGVVGPFEVKTLLLPDDPVRGPVEVDTPELGALS